MALKDLFKIFKKAPEKKTVIDSNDSFVRTSVIWNTFDHIIFLISCTEDYALPLCEFIEACNITSAIKVRMLQSSFDELDGKDKYGDPIYISHKRLYTVVAGSPGNFGHLMTELASLANPIWSAIEREIYNNCHYAAFAWLEQYGVFNRSDFLYQKTHPKYDENCEVGPHLLKNVDFICYTDPEVVLSRLPISFTGRSILRMINVEYGNVSANAEDILHFAFADIEYDDYADDSDEEDDLFTIDAVMTQLEDLYKFILKRDVTEDALKSLIEPLFLHNEDGTVVGDISDEHLDEIFRQSYDRFSAVADDNTQYEDIDERLEDDEESENMRKEDIIEDDTY